VPQIAKLVRKGQRRFVLHGPNSQTKSVAFSFLLVFQSSM